MSINIPANHGSAGFDTVRLISVTEEIIYAHTICMKSSQLMTTKKIKLSNSNVHFPDVQF